MKHFVGTIGALVLASAGLHGGGISYASSEASRSIRFVRPPVVVVEHVSGRPRFTAFLRVDRALPEDRQGALAEISLAGDRTDLPLSRFRRGRAYCYTGTVGNDFGNRRLRDVEAGDVLPLALRPQGQGRATRTRVRLVAPANALARLRALGC